MKALRFLIVAVAFLFLASCYETETSEVLEEQAQVINTVYVPAHEDTVPSVSVDADGGVSVDIDTVDVPPFWSITFKCQHGQFTVTGSKAQEMYNRLKSGDNVWVYYKEVFYKEEKDGKKVLTHKDYWFMDATHKRLTVEDSPAEKK